MFAGQIKKRFFNYVEGFKGKGSQSDFFVGLKEEHSRRVCREAFDLSRELGFPAEDRDAIQMAAILHDVGRFRQYEVYKTFLDSRSIDHAVFGVRVIRETGLLEGVAPETQDLVLKAILYHNRASLPLGESGRVLLFSRLLRDADKLDIWRVIIGDYVEKGGKGCAPVEAALPEADDLSDLVYQEVLLGKQVTLANIRNLNDLKVYRAGWVYDINFVPALARVVERQYLGRMRSTMPDTRRVREVFGHLERYVDQRIRGSESQCAFP